MRVTISNLVPDLLRDLGSEAPAQVRGRVTR